MGDSHEKVRIWGRAKAGGAWAALLACLAASALAGETKPKSGEDLYQSACAACHGPRGNGASRESVGFAVEPADFTDCNFAVREPDADWAAIIQNGGPARGFSEIMPAFGAALTAGEIQLVLDYVRGFCAEPAWPRGELNLPLALFTEKAFPEDEALLVTTIDAEGAGAVSHKIKYEKRFAARNQVEVAVPFRYRDRLAAGWTGGAGDIAVAYKRVLAHSLRSGSIFSASAEAVLPTGDEVRGFGNGHTVLEFFGTYGQILPADNFVQMQGGGKFPTRPSEAPRAAFWRTAVGHSLAQQGGTGRTWSPMVEFLTSRDFKTGASCR